MMGWIATLAGKREVEIDLQETTTLDDVIRNLFDMVDAEFRKQMYDPRTDELRAPSPVILINGRYVFASRREVRVSDGDLVVLIPPSAGG